MKKNILFSSFLLIIFFTLFSCRKIVKNESVNTHNSSAATYSSGGVTCICTGSVCGSNCSLGACCICIESGYQGACACYLGLPSCKTEKINNPSIVVYSDNIVVYHTKIQGLLLFLESNGINTTDLEGFYNHLVEHCTISGEVAQVNDPQYYYDFLNNYIALTNTMNQEQIDALQYYVDNI